MDDAAERDGEAIFPAGFIECLQNCIHSRLTVEQVATIAELHLWVYEMADRFDRRELVKRIRGLLESSDPRRRVDGQDTKRGGGGF
jgi:hypothetical protein